MSDKRERETFPSDIQLHGAAMKNQYFGDINDYRKYGLLRAISRSTGLRLLIAWMLTPDDGSPDGNFISYLENPSEWAHHDPVLLHGLKRLVASGQQRRVHMIEQSDLLNDAGYFSSIVPDSAVSRAEWFRSLRDQAQSYDFVFLDPDNGIEVKSKPYGAKNSSKYLYLREIESLWLSGKSLLIYQHFIRQKRVEFIRRMIETLSRVTPGSLLEAFSTSHVLFLMALQPSVQAFHGRVVDEVEASWSGQIRPWSQLGPNTAQDENML